MKPAYCALLALLLAVPARAEWPQKEYAREYESCAPRCETINPRERDKCASYCRCVTDGMQARFPDHGRFAREVLQQQLHEDMASLQRLADHCNHQVWGTPARKLRFR